MIQYSVEAGLCWLVFYGIYYAFLRKETFFKSNRIYLLGTLILGLALPLIPSFQWFTLTAQNNIVGASILEPITITAQQFSNTLETIVVTADHQNSFPIWTLLFYVWIIGASLSLLRLCLGLFKLGKLYFGGVRKKMAGYYQVDTTKAHLPFSFMNTLFWSNYFLEVEQEKNKILQHELVHIQKRHSIDNLFIAILLIPFWWIPPLYAYQKSLKTIHEYEADAEVTRSGSVTEYGHLLLQYAKSGFQLPLINSFAFTQLKTRIIMMTQQKSNPRQKLKYLAILPVLFVMVAFLANTSPTLLVKSDQSIEEVIGNPFDEVEVRAQIKKAIYAIKYNFRDGNKLLSSKIFKLKKVYPKHQSEIDTIFKEEFNAFIAANNINDVKASDILNPENIKPDTHEGETIFQVVDVMPMFPGCSDEQNAIDNSCANKKMLEFIYTNIKYPARAKELGTEGTVVVRFIVDKTGAIIAPEVVRSIGGGCDEEVLRVIKLSPNWNPGIQNGKAVKVYFNLPVKFKLEGKAKSKIAEKARISGCEDLTNPTERKDCANKKLLTEVYSNIKYPELARKNGIQGVSILRFDVGIDGKIKNPGFKKFIGGDCEEAILKVYDHLEATSTWIPAKNTEGEYVEAEMVLPIKFKLEDDDLPQESMIPLSLDEYKLFPNPAQQTINIAFHPSESQSMAMEVIDASGKVVLSKKLGMVEGKFNQQLDISNWPAGNYFIKLNGNEETFIDQFIKQ